MGLKLGIFSWTFGWLRFNFFGRFIWLENISVGNFLVLINMKQLLYQF